MSESKISCFIEDIKDLTVNPKTVGTPFVLSCRGEFNVPLSDKAQIKFESEESKYLIQILEYKSSNAEHIEWLATSYKVGEHEPVAFTIIDGENSFQSEGVGFSVESVLTEETPPEGFPPYGPFSMSYPIWIWIALFSTILVVALLISRSVRLRRQKRRLIEQILGGGYENANINELIRTGSKVAYSEFNREMRKLQKELNPSEAFKSQEFFSELKKIFYIYLAKRFFVPAHKWPVSQVMKDIKKGQRKIYDLYGREIRYSLREFQKSTGKKVTYTDCEQIFKKLRKLADDIEKSSNEVRR